MLQTFGVIFGYVEKYENLCPFDITCTFRL